MNLRRLALYGIFFAATEVSACTPGDRGRDLFPDEAQPSDDPLPGQPAHCDGLCVATAPATYTGPSLFWIGAPELAEGCPPETPDQGIEGYVTAQSVMLFARECRVTPSDLCGAEGQVCAPLPRPEFHVCVHRLGDSPCPADYIEQTEMTQDGTASKITVCCQKSPVPV